MIGLQVRRLWLSQGWPGKTLRTALLPFSCLYGLIIRLRNVFFLLGWIKTKRLNRPVISVGNLTVGGTGKTPTCLWLALELKKLGFKVAILSRGYRRKERSRVILFPGEENSAVSSAKHQVLLAGDEPAMMSQLYQQIVGVGKNRYETGLKLLAQHEVDLIILDDGYQHRRLSRDVDLLLLGEDYNGRILPSGPFREPRTSLRRADFFLLTGAEERWRPMLPADGLQRCYSGRLASVSLVGFETHRWTAYPLSMLYGSKIVTVTGVAKPDEFYRMLHDWEGDIVQTLEYPDHHCYTTQDWQRINRIARTADYVLTTEKDILKLVSFPFAKGKLLALRVSMAIEGGDKLVNSIVAKIKKDGRHAVRH